MSRKTPDDFAHETSPQTRTIAGLVRRFVVTLTRTSLWQILGHRLLDDTDETHDAPVFGGIGYHARPPADGSPEAIVVFPGGASNPLIAALRDEKTRAAVFKIVGEMQADESAVFNSSAIVFIKAGGTVEIRSLAGAAVSLAKQSDLQALRDHVNTLLTGGTGSAVVPAPSAGTGTLKLRGE